MNNPARAQKVTTTRSRLKIHLPSEDLASSARWLINGFPATVTIWTAEEWDRLSDQPLDVQLYPNGIRCALRME